MYGNLFKQIFQFAISSFQNILSVHNIGLAFQLFDTVRLHWAVV